MIRLSSDVRLRRPQLQGVPHVVLGDPGRVRGVLLNLYTNAAKFTKKGAISLKVPSLAPSCSPLPTLLSQDGPHSLRSVRPVQWLPFCAVQCNMQIHQHLVDVIARACGCEHPSLAVVQGVKRTGVV